MNGAQDFLAWLDNFLFGHRQPTDSGWRSQPAPDTGSHQFPDAFKGIDVLDGIVGGPRWNGPVGTRTAAYLEERNHTGNTPIPATPGDTGAIQRPLLSVREIHRLHEMVEAPTAPQLPGTEWLYERIPTGALPPHVKDAPALRQQVVNPAPSSRQIAANTGAIDDMLMTLGSARDRYRLDLPALQDLPTVPSQGRVIEQTIEALPPAPEDFPRWLTVDPPTLIPLAEDVIASTDRTAISNPLGVTVADMQPDLSVTEPTELSRKVRDQRAIEQLLNETKESEG